MDSNFEHYSRGPIRSRAQEISAASVALLQALLDRKPFPVLLIRPSLEVGFVNRAAAFSLAADGIAISRHGTMQLSEASANERLRNTMKTLARETSLIDNLRMFVFELPDGTTRILKIEALDIPAFAGAEAATTGAWFEVSVRGSLRCSKVPAGCIESALGLTWAEANLAAALAEGLTLQDYADREHVKITTVRWHLQNVFNRTGARSQSELVGMMVSLFG